MSQQPPAQPPHDPTTTAITRAIESTTPPGVEEAVLAVATEEESPAPVAPETPETPETPATPEKPLVVDPGPKDLPKRGLGRPTKLTPALQAQIVLALSSTNCYMETAAAYAGINADTFLEWMKRGRRGRDALALLVPEDYPDDKPLPKKALDLLKTEGKFVEFSGAVEKAIANAEVRDLNTIGKASAENWAAAAWRLERRFQDRYVRRVAVQGGGAGAPPITTESQLNVSGEMTVRVVEFALPLNGFEPKGDAAGAAIEGPKVSGKRKVRGAETEKTEAHRHVKPRKKPVRKAKP